MIKNPIKMFIFILMLFLLSFILYPKSLDDINSNSKAGISQDTKSIRAISLRVLQEKLKTYDNLKSYTDELLKLTGIKTIMGYIVDKANNDIIIFGKTNPKLPPIYLEDFVLALRNAWLKYASLKGNTYEYSFPGCSIDPNPGTIKKLQSIGQQITPGSSPEKVEQQLKSWRRVCNENQSVRVMGIPFHTRFARVMVEADYDMKCIVNGTDALNIPGLISLTDMKFEAIRRAIVNGRQIAISPASMDRFWFYPGNNVYEEDQGIVLIKHCPVNLLTEEMYVSSSGSFTSGDRADPQAKLFAESFSILYDKVEYERHIYRELENLFRFVALAKIIKFKSAHTEAGLDCNYFLENFQVSSDQVKQSLPGRSAVKEFKHRQESQNGYNVAQLWLPSCGGVSINIQPERIHFVKNSKGTLSNLKSRILNSRRSTNSLSWDVSETKEELLSDIESSNAIFDRNIRDKNFSNLSVRFDENEGYKIFKGTNDPIYSSHSSINVFKTIISRMDGIDLKKTVHFNLNELPNIDKMEAFKTTIRMQAKQLDNIRLEIIDCDNNLLAKFNSEGEIAIDKSTRSIKNVTQGIYKNWYTFSFNFITNIAGKIYKLTIYVYAKTLELAQAFLNRLESFIKIYFIKPVTLFDKINEIFNDLKKTHNLKKGDIRIEFKSDLKEIEIGKTALKMNWRNV